MPVIPTLGIASDAHRQIQRQRGIEKPEKGWFRGGRSAVLEGLWHTITTTRSYGSCAALLQILFGTFVAAESQRKPGLIDTKRREHRRWRDAYSQARAGPQERPRLK
eukprot:1059944-Rhodomonas_salina.2